MADAPRIRHHMVLEHDALGHPTRACDLFYPRRASITDRLPEQAPCRGLVSAIDYLPPLDSQTLSLTGLTHDTRNLDLPDLAEPDPGTLRDKARFKLRGGFWWATSPVGSHDMTLGDLCNLLLQSAIFWQIDAGEL
jgi:hypothetical protein